MIRKMRWKFISAAMTAFTLVMLLLLIGVNTASFFQASKTQENILNGILEYEQLRTQQPKEELPPISDMGWADGPGKELTARFFSVHCDRDGIVNIISRDYITSIDDAAAKEYTTAVLSLGREQGTYQDYRYLVSTGGEEITVVFLNISNDQKRTHSLMAVSAAIGIVSLLLVFGLTVLFSRRAVQPYMRNMEQQKRFITDASHELKTPLTSISTSADILSMEEEENEWVVNIQKQSRRMAKLINALVTLSRLDEEFPLPEKTRFCLTDVIWEAAEPFAALAKAKGKQYHLSIADNLYLQGERGYIQQMLSLMLDNAIKYADEGSAIALTAYACRGRACITLTNVCSSLEEGDLDRLFDRFYRPDASRAASTGGSGIGLSIAKAIAQAHGGTISVCRPDEKSITFRILL